MTTEGRKFVKLRGLSILMTVGAMVLLGVALALIVGFPAVPGSWPRFCSGRPRSCALCSWPCCSWPAWTRLPLRPDRDKPKWGWASPGSVVATVLWCPGCGRFSIYVNAFGN